MSGAPKVTVGYHSIAGKKESNDDSYGVLVPDSPLLETKGIAMAIADGMSTSEAGKEASETCVKSFFTDYYCTHESWTVKTSVGRVLTALNRWLYSQGQSQYLSNRGMVSTFSGMVLKSSTAHIFHVGDSRIYLLRNGSIQPLTIDHRTRMSKDREVLTRAFGIDMALEVDYKKESVQIDDIFIFTTDGIHDFLKDTEISKIAQEYEHNLDLAAKTIVDRAFENGSGDNLTCQIVKVDHPGAETKSSHLRKLTSRPFPPELEPGMLLDGYRIKRSIHLSSRSQVYLAIDEETGESVAIKTPSVNFEDNPAYIELFTREDWVGRQISNPNIIRIIPEKRKRRFLYIVAEFIDGSKTLRQWMFDNPSPSLVEVRRIVNQIAKGLRALHRKEMIHQDLKPENIIIDDHGTVKIIDLGSTRVAGLDEIKNPVETPELLGTQAYTAPEYFLGQKPTNRSDIYSLGVITYEMLTARHPFGKGFASAGDVKKLTSDPAHKKREDVPHWVSWALDKAIQVNPSRRYETLSGFMTDLEIPNPASAEYKKRPLIEQNPVLFWKTLALAFLLLNLIQLIIRFS
ncbi:MAG: protein kinase domain-containing protein [Methyloligellaceae bacterium]